MWINLEYQYYEPDLKKDNLGKIVSKIVHIVAVKKSSLSDQNQ